MIFRRWLMLIALALALAVALPAPAAHAQSGGSLEDFGDDGDDDDDDDPIEEMGEQAETVQKALGIYDDYEQFMSQWDNLAGDEADCGAAYTADAGPSVPSQCAESDDCMQCYGEAVRAIDFNRFYIERARCITAANVRMANSAIAFGDSSSGVHGVSGLAWSLGGKPQVEKAVSDLKGTYTRKANDYLREIDRSMRQLGQCEAEHFGERDWYQRYGWLYVNFMRSKYSSAPE